MPPFSDYRVCPQIIRDLIKKKENGQKSIVIHNKDVAVLLLPTDVPWNKRPIPHNIIIQSLKLLNSACLFPPPGYESEEQSCSRGMAVRFIKVGVGVSV